MKHDAASDYLKALRDGLFLKFLQWPDTIAEHYQMDKNTLTAELLADLLVYEWLHAGFEEEDIRQMVLLYSMTFLKEHLLRGKLDFCLTSLLLALTMCMAFKGFGLEVVQNEKKLMTNKDIAQWIKNTMQLKGDEAWELALSHAWEQIQSMAKRVDLLESRVCYSAMESLLKPRDTVENYLQALLNVTPEQDGFITSRQSLVQTMGIYLNQQYQWSEAVEREVRHYVELIRDLRPKPWEAQYLDALAPMSLLDEGVVLIKTLGYRLFQLVVSNDEDAPEHKPKP